MYREWNVFGRLRQALVYIQITNALGRRPRPSSTYSQPFRPGRGKKESVLAGMYDLQESAPTT